MKNYDESVEINHSQNWSYIRNHPYKILIFGGLGSGKTNVSLNLIKPQRPDIDKIYCTSKIHLDSRVLVTFQQERKSRDKEI